MEEAQCSSFVTLFVGLLAHSAGGINSADSLDTKRSYLRLD